jgi:hypothetical protein
LTTLQFSKEFTKVRIYKSVVIFKNINSIKMAFSGIKDVDLKILSKLEDKDLLNVCITKNKYVYHICNDENFWRNRILKKYGNFIVYYKPEDSNWKKFYMQTIIDLERFKDAPMKFFRQIVWYKDIYNSFYVKHNDNLEIEPTYIRLDKAPTWVLLNLYLLNLGRKIRLGVYKLQFRVKTFYNPTPIELLNFLNENLRNRNSLIIDIEKEYLTNIYYPRFDSVDTYQ